MKKKVLFYNGSLRMGGIERVLVEVLQNIDRSEMDIDLLIEDGIRSLNVFEKDIPKEISITYLKDEKLINLTNKFRERKKNIFCKLIYNLLMNYEAHVKKYNLKKMLIDKKYDVVIDFDMGLSKHIDLIKANKKIAWVHASIKHWTKKKVELKGLENDYKSMITLLLYVMK